MRVRSMPLLSFGAVVAVMAAGFGLSVPTSALADTSSSDTVTQTSPSGTSLSISALSDNIVRAWFRPSLAHSRLRSNAMADTLPALETPTSLKTSHGVDIGSKSLTLQIDPSTLATTVKANDRVLIDSLGFQWTDNGGWSISYKLRPDEHLLGLGQDNRNGGHLDRRGTVRDLWTGQQINSGNVTANYPVPFLISVDSKGNAYGIFIDDVYHMKFDLGASDPNTLTCAAGGGEPDFYIINGPTMKDVVERYTLLTGRSPLPPLWTLGYWQSKCWFTSWDDVDSAYNGLISHNFPVDAMVLDSNWPEKRNDMVWDTPWFTQGLTPEQRIAQYTSRGVKIFLSNSGPMVVKDSPTFPSGWKAGVFATDGHGNPVTAGYYDGELMDFTSPNMTSWYLTQVAPLIKAGIAGWWLDLSEPEGDNASTTYYGGTTASIHNQYSLLETRWFENAQLAVKPNQRPWVLTRCASAGIQRYHMSVWSGDTHSDYATFKAHPPEMLNSGLSGLTYWTSDSGGFLSGFYKNDQYGAHAKLYERWMQLSTFSPITRAHHSGPVLPFNFGPETEKGCLHYIQLRYKLLPYIYSYAWDASQTGLPITRPLIMEFPADAGSYSVPGDEYLFGQNLLVAPVLTEDATSRSVYFPPGKWFDWDTGREYDGGKTITVDAPQNRIPVAVRAGAIIPLAPLMTNTSAKPWDPITVLVYPSGSSSFTMYSDDGATFNYEKGAHTLTTFTSDRSSDREIFTTSESNKLFAPHMYSAQMHLDQNPVSVMVDGVTIKPVSGVASQQGNRYSWSPGLGILTVNFASGKELNHKIDITLGAFAHGAQSGALPN